MELNICHLYPDVLNLYGDRGNIACMKKRLEWRGIGCAVTELPLGTADNLTGYDLFFIGGGQDFEQTVLLADLRAGRAENIRAAIGPAISRCCFETGPEVPEAANFGVRVAGDSMEPRFHSGQTVWVHQQPTLDPGEIGVFLYDGSAYLKQLRRDGGRVFLHSLNPAYADLEVSDALPLRVLGKAVS